MEIIAARNLPSLKKNKSIIIKRQRAQTFINSPPVTFINSLHTKAHPLTRNSINEKALHIMTGTKTFLVHYHTSEHFKISARDKEETGMLRVSKSPRMFGLGRLPVAEVWDSCIHLSPHRQSDCGQSVVQTLVYTRSVDCGCRLTEEAL